MKIISIQNKDIYVTLEIGLHDIEKVIRALDHAEIQFDAKNDNKTAEASTFLIDVFYKTLKEVVDDLVDGEV